jgi:hypothetical protein
VVVPNVRHCARMRVICAGLLLHRGVNMAESMEHREKIQRSLEDIHRSLVAVSMKLAQLQLDADTDTELGSALEDGMTVLAPLTDRLESLESAFQMETNRLRNEGEL